MRGLRPLFSSGLMVQKGVSISWHDGVTLVLKENKFPGQAMHTIMLMETLKWVGQLSSGKLA